MLLIVVILALNEVKVSVAVYGLEQTKGRQLFHPGRTKTTKRHQVNLRVMCDSGVKRVNSGYKRLEWSVELI